MWCSMRSFNSSARRPLASSSVIGKKDSSYKWARTMFKSSTGSSFPEMSASLAYPFSSSNATRSGGSFARAASLDWRDCPRAASTHQSRCCGGTLAVEMIRARGSTSRSEMRCLLPGLLGSFSLIEDSLCWLHYL